MYILIVCFLLTATFTSGQNVQLHDHLDAEQLRSFFKLNDGPIPQHDVVPIMHSISQNINQPYWLQLNAFGKNLKLYLNPSDGLLAGSNMSIWTANYDKSKPFQVTYHKIKKYERTKIFEDVNNMAVISVTMNRFGRPSLDGIIDGNLRINPLPHHLMNDIHGPQNLPLTKKLLQLNFNNQNLLDSHVIYRIDQPINTKYQLPKRGLGYAMYQQYHNEVRRKREITSENESNEVPSGFPTVPPQIPKMAYPELFVIVDYDLYLSLGKDYSDVVKYVLSYFQAVDLRFRQFKIPEIRLNIKGIIINTDRDALPYIRKNRLGKNLVEIDGALDTKAVYFQQEKTFALEEDYDILVTLTGLDMCQKSKRGPYCNPSPLGYSYETGGCVELHLPKKNMIESIAMVEDNGGFSGVIPTAHELGHLMGASHDENECSDGYIMDSRYTTAPKSFQWSSCSMESITQYFQSPRAGCLFTKPTLTRKVYPRLLPGKIFSLEDQCKQAFNSTPCFYDERVCTYLECYVPQTGYCVAKSAAVEGSSCGQNKICINGKCLTEDKEYYYV